MQGKFSTRVALILGASTATLLAAAPALAQTSATSAPAAGAVEELIVTAQRREESINSVGMSIQAVRGDTLQQLHVTDTRDLSTLAPSFTV